MVTAAMPSTVDSCQLRHPGGEVSTINGSIRADDNAQMAGGHTVNGNISLGDHATAKSLTTVNGGIVLGQGAKVSATVTTVNGTLALRTGSEVGGRLANVNGTIILAAATVNGGINTVNGNIDIGANSHVQGGIIVHKPSTGFFHWWSDSDKPRVVVGPGAVIDGTMHFERAVRLYVSDTATIGPVTGATRGQVLRRPAAQLTSLAAPTLVPAPCGRVHCAPPREPPKAHPGGQIRDVAQPGRALRSGRRCRRFKSCHPDH